MGTKNSCYKGNFNNHSDPFSVIFEFMPDDLQKIKLQHLSKKFYNKKLIKKLKFKKI